MIEKRFRTGKGILEEGYFSETIIDNETGKAYYKGYANYESAKEMCELLNKLIDENEQLKSTIKEVTELLSDEVDLFSEKATEHDIIAYVELKELDNKDAFYMATATKEAIRMLKELLE